MSDPHENETKTLAQLREDVLEPCKNGDLGHVKEGLTTLNFFPPLKIPAKPDYHTSLAIPASSSAQYLSYKMIEISCKAGQANVLGHLTLAFPIMPFDEESLWAVLGAIRSGDPETLKVLCEADPHLSFSHYGSPLSQAILMYHQDRSAPMVEVLLQAGASLAYDPNANSTRCPMYAAVVYGTPAVFEVMMRYGGEEHLEGFDPLVEAAAHENKHIILHLLRSGEDVNTVDEAQPHRTPLFAAAAKGHDQVVLFLLAWASRSSLTCTGLQLSADVARRNGHMAVAEILETWKEGSKVVVDKETELLRLQ